MGCASLNESCTHDTHQFPLTGLRQESPTVLYYNWSTEYCPEARHLLQQSGLPSRQNTAGGVGVGFGFGSVGFGSVVVCSVSIGGLLVVVVGVRVGESAGGPYATTT